jgi:hypothetical protein
VNGEEITKILGLSKKIWLILVAIFLIEAAIFLFLLIRQQAKMRDALRIADMSRLQTGFELLFFEKASYKPAGCQEGDLVAKCQLEKYIPEIKQLHDPGKGSYQVIKTPDDESYAISFVLEKGIGHWSKGQYVLTPQGIIPAEDFQK